MSRSERPSTPGARVLEVRGAAKRFGDVVALGGVDLHLAKGEWLGLLGPNGAGKTTLVRAIAGRVVLDAGEVSLLGQPLAGPGAKSGAGPGAATARRRLGVVPQEVALYPLLTARENLQAFGALHGLRGAELGERVERVLEWTGLGERSEEPTERFSGGMRRRLNIGASVLHRPEVLLLDEPTVGVDPQSRERIWEMLEELRREGASLLLTTHQLDEAQAVCERIVILDRGAVIAEGGFEDLVARTVGRGRRVSLTLERPLEDAEGLAAERLDDGRRLAFRAEDVGRELAAVLAEVGRRGGVVADVEVSAPSLQAVFLHLTGRELRE